MFSKIVNIENLRNAFIKLKRNITETPFYGDISIDFYEKHLETNLILLQKILLERSYIPNTLRVYKINKGTGDIRYTYKRDFEDYIIEIAILNVLGPIFEEMMDDNSFGNRLVVDENPHNFIYKPYWNEYQKFENHILNTIMSTSDNDKVIRSDIINFFEKINSEILINYLREKDIPADVIDLIELFLNIATERSTEKKVAQGTFLAPFLANVYLIPFDDFLRESEILNYFRYVDDFIVILKEDQDENTFYYEIQNYLKTKFLLDLHEPTRDYECEDFKKSFIGTLKDEVKDRFNQEVKKRIYGETRLVENLIKSGNIDSILFLQTLLLYTGQKEESSISEKDMINFTQRFLIYWRNTFPELSDHLNIERIASKILKLNQITNINRIRLFLFIILEANNGKFSIFLKNLLRTPPDNIIRDAFLSILPYFISDENFDIKTDVREILEYYIMDEDIDNYTKKLLCQLTIQMENSDLIKKLIDLHFISYLIKGYQTSHKLSLISREGRNNITLNQFIEAFNSTEAELVLESYKFLNYVGYAQDFFNYCSQPIVINKIISNQKSKCLFIQLLIYCDGLSELNTELSFLFNSRESFTIRLIETILNEFLNFTNVDNLGLSPNKYYKILCSCNNFFRYWDLQKDLKNKIDLKVGSYSSILGNFANFPFATLFPNIHFLTVSPTVIREVRTGSNMVSEIFKMIPEVEDFESSKNFLNECFGDFSMITDINMDSSNKEYIIEYQVPEDYSPLSNIIYDSNISTLKNIKKLIKQLKLFKEKTKIPYYFLNAHNIYINPNLKKVKFFGFFPNLDTRLCKYIPNNDENIPLVHNNKIDLKCLGYLLFDIFSSEKISSFYRSQKTKKREEIKNPYLTYIIIEKLLNEDYDKNYPNYEFLEKDIDYAIKKWQIYANEYDEFFKILDFTVFKIIKMIYVVQNPKNVIFLFNQGKKIFNYLMKSDLINYLKQNKIEISKNKNGDSQKNQIETSIFSREICNIIQISKQELKKCNKVDNTEKAQCLLNFQSLFNFLLFFCEFERFSTHFITIIKERIRDLIKKIIKKYPNISMTTKYNVNAESINSNILKIVEVIINLNREITAQVLLEQFSNFESVINFFEFFSTQKLILIAELKERRQFIIEPALKDILHWNSDIKSKLNRIKTIYENITKIPIEKQTYIENNEILMALLKWLIKSKISLKIYNKKIEDFKKLFDMHEIVSIEIKYWTFFRKRKKSIDLPFMIPSINILPNEKKIFPVEFINRRFKPKIASFIYPIQYENLSNRIKSYIKIHKYNISLLIIELILGLFLLFNINSFNNFLLSLIAFVFLPGIKTFIENFIKKS